MSKKYHLFIANLENYKNRSIEEPTSFLPLLKEANEDNGYISWHISSKNGVGIHEVKEGDICLIYYSNLPDGTNRILFYGKVIETDYGKTENDKLLYDNKERQYGVKFLLRSIELYNQDSPFTRQKLQKDYGIKQFRSYQKLYPDNELHNKLINDLNSYITNGKGSKIKEVYEYFESFCQCQLNKQHQTFLKRNGFNYIEIHHLVPQSLLNKNKNLENLIYNKNNEFKLCPICHRKIHYGTKEITREMIEKLYLSKKEFYDHNLKPYTSNPLNWLYEIYNIE